MLFGTALAETIHEVVTVNFDWVCIINKPKQHIICTADVNIFYCSYRSIIIHIFWLATILSAS